MNRDLHTRVPIRQLIAYPIAKDVTSRSWTLRVKNLSPVILFCFCSVVVLMICLQVALLLSAEPTTYHPAMYQSPSHYLFFPGGGAFWSRMHEHGHGGRLNLHALLSRHVPSISRSQRIIHNVGTKNELNQLLKNEWNSLYSATNQTSHNETREHRKYVDCSPIPEHLQGDLKTHVQTVVTKGEVESSSSVSHVRHGGEWQPQDCISRHRVAIVIPYRDRAAHLFLLLKYLHGVLARQQLRYKIYVVEQFGNLTFNKARIMNIAFVHALNDYPHWDCFVFHDVDLVPESDHNLYSCPEQPRHMSPAIDEMNYVVPYDDLVGGVLAIRTDHFRMVNGYSNLYWGWGAEDDDIAYRIRHVGLQITRPPQQLGRYKMIPHKKRTAVDSRIRYQLLWTGIRRFPIDGINSLSSLNFSLISVKRERLYTHLLVEIGKPPDIYE